MQRINDGQPIESSAAHRADGGDQAGLLPLIVWLGIQLVGLLLLATPTPLWAKANPPFEQYALMLMQGLQALASAAFLGWLMGQPRLACAVVISAIPFLQLAGLLAGASFSDVLEAMGWMLAWLWGLALWGPALRGDRQRGIATATALCVVVGVAMWAYLIEEFGGEAVDWKVCWRIISGAGLVSSVVGWLIRRAWRQVAGRATTYPQTNHSRFSRGGG
ncbi:hypothetical protein [Fontivita pretiosa]|uniref:hypothetical protein n=1 Tax=Fontivita pretiosa TaxID=2989684 RepID=UPI003D1631D7